MYEHKTKKSRSSRNLRIQHLERRELFSAEELRACVPLVHTSTNAPAIVAESESKPAVYGPIQPPPESAIQNPVAEKPAAYGPLPPDDFSRIDPADPRLNDEFIQSIINTIIEIRHSDRQPEGKNRRDINLAHDVNEDGKITPLDALQLINAKSRLQKTARS